MNAPIPRYATSCAVISENPMDLTRIFEPATQIAQWCRPPASEIVDWLDWHCNRLGTGLRQTLSPGQTPDLGRLPAGAGRDALADDLRLLAEMLGDLLDAPSIGLRLEVIRQAMCPRLHVDRVGIRMLCTYRGAGTEWVEERDVDRRFLGAGAGGLPDDASGLLRAGYRIESIPPYTVALLKGTLWQGNAGRGIVHRSPAVPYPPRVLVALDAGW